MNDEEIKRKEKKKQLEDMLLELNRHTAQIKFDNLSIPEQDAYLNTQEKTLIEIKECLGKFDIIERYHIVLALKIVAKAKERLNERRLKGGNIGLL